MDTPDAERLYRVDERQLRALEVLATGGSHADAAQAAGVHRVTVTRWANSHPGFQAERNRRREELSSVLADKAGQIDVAVLDKLLDLVLEGDADAITLWVRQRGFSLVRATEAAPQTPHGVMKRLVAEREASLHAEREQALMAGLADEGAVATVDAGEIRREIEAELLADLDEVEPAPDPSDTTGENPVA